MTFNRKQEQREKTAFVILEGSNGYMEPLDVDGGEGQLQVGDQSVIDLMLNHLQACGITRAILGIRGDTHRYAHSVAKFKHGTVMQTPRGQGLSSGPRFRGMTVKLVPVNDEDEIQLLQRLIRSVDDLEYPCYIVAGPMVSNVRLDGLAVSGACAGTVVFQSVSEGSLLRQAEGDLVLETTPDGGVIRVSRPQQTHGIVALNFPRGGLGVELRTGVQLSGLYACREALVGLVLQETGGKTLSEMLCAYYEREEPEQLRISAYFEQPGELSARIDSPRTYRGACRAYLKRYFYPYTPDSRLQKQYKTAVVGNQTQFGPAVLISDLCVIGEKCCVDGSVIGAQIGDGCHIAEGALVRDSILMGQVIVQQGAVLDECIVMKHAVIKKDVVLPRGSIVGPDCTVDTATVEHTVRAFLNTVWGDSVQFASGKPTKTDTELIEAFRAGLTRGSAELFSSLPPIYIVHQQMRQADYDFYMTSIQQVENQPVHSAEPQNFVQYYRMPLHKMQRSSVKQIEDADRRSYAESEYYDSNTAEECIEEYVEEEEIGENSADDLSILQSETQDSTAPSKLASRIVDGRQTAALDAGWIPNYLLRKARELFQTLPTDTRENPYQVEEQINAELRPWFLKLQECIGYQKQTFHTPRQTIPNAIYTKESTELLRPTARFTQTKTCSLCAPKYVIKKTTYQDSVLAIIQSLFQAKSVDAEQIKNSRRNLQSVLIQQLSTDNDASAFEPHFFKCICGTMVTLSLGWNVALNEENQVDPKTFECVKSDAGKNFAKVLGFISRPDSDGNTYPWLYAKELQNEDRVYIVEELMMLLVSVFLEHGNPSDCAVFAQAFVDSGIITQDELNCFYEDCSGIEPEDLDETMAYVQKMLNNNNQTIEVSQEHSQSLALVNE